MTSQAINTFTSLRPILRPVARLLIVAQLALVLQPLSVLAQDKGQAPFNPAAQAQVQRLGQLSQRIEQAKAEHAKAHQSPADQASAQLARVQELVAQLQGPSRSRLATATATATATTTTVSTADARTPERLGELRRQLATLDDGAAQVRAEFAATRAELVRKNLSPDILARHDQATTEFEQRAQQFKQISAPSQSGEALVQALDGFFQQYPAQRRQTPIEPGKLPWSTPKATPRMPAESASAWQQALNAGQPEQAKTTALKQNQSAQARSAPLSALAAAPIAPTPADLAETDEVQLTPAIRAKALELGHNPVTIYNWVRNNIEFAPTAGAIQSAQDTLDKKRGNATDTASLLIALLRAANIPARYQFGVVDIDAAKVQNWVGGTNKPEAALQILNQGGIAARGLSSAGRFATIRMEHVWVKAYVNWMPSRGNRNATATQHLNPNDSLNAWTPLDASFKQYSYSAGMDLKTAVPLDAAALLTAAQEGATVNATEGWVQNLNQVAIQSQLSDYQARLKSYIDSTPTGPTSTVGDVIGKQIIPQQAQPLLAGTLPNTVVLQAAELAAIPSALQHKFTYKLYASDTDKANDNALLSFTEKTSRLVGKRLTLSYVPATPADADLIASYLPKPHADGSPILPSELPTSLPGYLIRLKAQINLDGQVVAQASQAVQMGTDLYSAGGFTQLYDPSQWDLTSEESNVAGQATAIGISAGGISAAQLTQLKDRLNTVKTKLEAQDVTGLSGEQVSGDLLTATIWSWFAAAESHNRLSQNQAGMIENPGLSYGLFHAVAQPVYSWGVIRKVTFPGVNMDIGHVRNLTWSKDHDEKSWVAYNRLRGQYMSALEGAVPERFFNDPSRCNIQGSTTSNPALPACPQGVSAVKAIALGAQAGQRIFTITREVYASNPDIVSTKLSAHSASTRDRVQQALDVGYEVSIHEAPISQDGWTGAGFTMIDPSTGAGGYIVEGGSNGGSLFLDVLKGAAAGALLALAVLAIPFQILLMINGFLFAAFLLGLFGAAFVAGSIAMGVDPLMVALFRVTVATILCFNALAFGAAAAVAPIAAGIFIIWLLASIAFETTLLLALRE